MSSMYQELILDHYRNPRNFGQLDNPDIKSRDSNPLCGDILEFQLKLNSDGRLKDVRFNGKGCAISQASASMLTEMVQGKTLEEARNIDKRTILDALGIELSPVRIKCALLSLKVLKIGIYSYLGLAPSSSEETSLEKPAD